MGDKPSREASAAAASGKIGGANNAAITANQVKTKELDALNRLGRPAARVKKLNGDDDDDDDDDGGTTSGGRTISGGMALAPGATPISRATVTIAQDPSAIITTTPPTTSSSPATTATPAVAAPTRVNTTNNEVIQVSRRVGDTTGANTLAHHPLVERLNSIPQIRPLLNEDGHPNASSGLKSIDPVAVTLFYGELRQHMSALASHALNREMPMFFDIERLDQQCDKLGPIIQRKKVDLNEFNKELGCLIQIQTDMESTFNEIQKIAGHLEALRALLPNIDAPETFETYSLRTSTNRDGDSSVLSADKAAFIMGTVGASQRHGLATAGRSSMVPPPAAPPASQQQKGGAKSAKSSPAPTPPRSRAGSSATTAPPPSTIATTAPSSSSSQPQTQAAVAAPPAAAPVVVASSGKLTAGDFLRSSAPPPTVAPTAATAAPSKAAASSAATPALPAWL